MIVSQKSQTIENTKRCVKHSFNELLYKSHAIALIDVRAIFYAHAHPTTEFLILEDNADDKAELAFWESNDD